MRKSATTWRGKSAAISISRHPDSVIGIKSLTIGCGGLKLRKNRWNNVPWIFSLFQALSHCFCR
jgi:hypothetical protein